MQCVKKYIIHMLFSVVDIGLKKEKKNRDKEGGKWVRHMKLEYEVTENDRRKGKKEEGRWGFWHHTCLILLSIRSNKRQPSH